jgi:hypothetical protein
MSTPDKTINPLQDIDFGSMGFVDPLPDDDRKVAVDQASPSPSPVKPDKKTGSPSPSPVEKKEEITDSSPSPSPAKPAKKDNEDDDDKPKGSPSPSPAPAERKVVEDILDIVGIEDLSADNYDDNVESLAQVVMDAGTKIAEQQLQSFFDEMPELGQMFDYLSSGGDPAKYHQTFHQSPDYDSIEIDPEDSAAQKQLVTRDLSEQGYEAEDIDKLVEKYEAAGILADQAQVALKSLKKRSAQRKEQLLEQQKKANEEQIAKVTKYWKDVEEHIDQNDVFSGVPIPKKEKKALFDYISKPVKPGLAQRDLDLQKATLEQRLALDYLLMKGVDLTKVIDLKVETKRASELKDRLKKKEVTNNSGRKKPHEKTTPEHIDIEELDLQL